jgi:16S rRNA processing protein RimM
LNNKGWKVSDIAGSDVLEAGGGKIGVLTDVLPSGGNDVWVVTSDDGEFLLPALTSVVLEVDVEKKRIVVQLPPGLKDVYREEPKPAKKVRRRWFKKR